MSNKNKNTRKSNNKRFGVFYKSHGKWTGPYAGATFTNYTINLKSVKADVEVLRKFILKSRVEIRPVTA